jgi:hypothetical protein
MRSGRGRSVRRTPGLLRLRNRDGDVVYPLQQFTADGEQVPGVADVVDTFAPALQPLSIACWLAAVNQILRGRPIDALREGDIDRVLHLARQLASSAGPDQASCRSCRGHTDRCRSQPETLSPPGSGRTMGP